MLEAVGGGPETEAEVAVLEDVVAERAGQHPGGQGFQASAALRWAVKRHAMAVAMAHYEGQGWRVSDVSATQPCDLYWLRGMGAGEGDREELRVEVKGTTTVGGQVLLTRGEVGVAQRLGIAGVIHQDADVGHTHVPQPWQYQPFEETQVKRIREKERGVELARVERFQHDHAHAPCTSSRSAQMASPAGVKTFRSPNVVATNPISRAHQSAVSNRVNAPAG